MKKILSVILCIIMVLCAAPLSVAFAADNTTLRFNKDGSFKILVLADCQDNKTPDPDMMEAINQLLDLKKPDLVMFTGDNVVEDKLSEFTQGLKALLAPIVARNIPYAFTFGNHDDEYGVSKDDQFSVYKSTGNCLTTDPVPSLTGVGTCNIPILHSGNDKMAFNLWIVDSNTYDRTNGGYDHVHDDQINWLKQKQNEITAAEGGIVNSMIFQHIIVPEVTSCLVQSSSGLWTYNGTKYAIQLNSKASGTLLEHPCPPTKNGGEYAAAVSMGGVLGIVTGHDHINDFIAKPGNVDLIQVGGMSYNSYHDDRVQGASLITLDENNTGTYTIERFLNTKLFAGEYGYPEREPVYVQDVSGKRYISDIKIAANSSDSAALQELINNGYTPIQFDLNKGAGGGHIFLGYKTTTNISQAITHLRASVSDKSGYSATKNFRGVSYTLASNIDLNKGAGGAYIYLYYSKQPGAGAPVTDLLVNETSVTAGYTVMGSFAGDSAADLNKDAKGAYVYIQMKSTLPVLDVKDFISAYETAKQTSVTGKAPERAAELQNAIAQAKTVYDSLMAVCRTNVSQSVINSYANALTQALNDLDLPHVHTPGSKVIENDKASTCAVKGSYDEVVYCTLCKEEISRNTVTKDLAAHTPGSEVTENVTTGTCLTKGACDKVIYCTVCEEELSRTKTETVYGEHKAGNKATENVIFATCTDKGTYEEVVYCTLCKTELSRKTVITDTVAHSDKNGDAYCDKCGADMSVSCSHLCHKSGFMGFIWKIINFFNKLFKINPKCSCGNAHW